MLPVEWLLRTLPLTTAFSFFALLSRTIEPVVWRDVLLLRTLVEVPVEPVVVRVVPVVIVRVSGRAVTVLGRDVVTSLPDAGRAVTVLLRDCDAVDTRGVVELGVEGRCVTVLPDELLDWRTCGVLVLELLEVVILLFVLLVVVTLRLLLTVDRVVVDLELLLLVVGL